MGISSTHQTFEADPSFRGLIGVARRDMTPEVGIHNHNWGSSLHETADSIHKPLYATALSFRSKADDTPFVVATLDYCWFPSYRLLASLRRPLIESLGIEDHHLLLVLTHSHSVPHIDPELESKPGGEKIAAYREKVIRALNEAVAEAVASPRPAVLSWGRGHASLARTRDYMDPESGQILCGPNPAGTADTTVLVGRVSEESSGKVLATLINYACHPVSLGGKNRSVSPDYIGSMRELVESYTADAPCIFLHGPSGNQTPRDCYAADPSVADRNGEILGFAAMSILRAMLPPGERLEFARAESSGAPLAVWETRPYLVDDTTASTVEYLRLPARNWPELAEVDQQLDEQTDPAARVRLTRLKQLIHNLNEGLGDGFPVWVMRLGQCVIVATPAEPFTDLQTELRKRFPQLAIVVTNDTNGSFNYLPPASYYGNGAYEQDCADFGPGCLEIVIVAATRLVQSLMGAPVETAAGRRSLNPGSYTWT